MAIYQKTKNGCWYYAVYAGGRRLRGSCGTKDREEALLFEQTVKYATKKTTTRAKILRLVDVLFEPEEKVLPDIGLDVVASEATRLAELAGKVVSEKTIAQRRQAVTRFIKWAEKKWPKLRGVRDVDRSCAQAFSDWLKRDGLSDKTRWNLISHLSASWNLLKRGYDDIKNPWPLAAPISHQSEVGKAFSAEQVKKIFAAADEYGHEFGLACRIAAATGLRYGDVANLKHEDVKNGVIWLTPSKTKSHGVKVKIPLPQEIVEMIPQGHTGYIMPEQARIYKNNYRRGCAFKDILKMAKVDSKLYTFHSFRHYFRTRLSEINVPEEIAMKLGGWTQRKTASRYDHDEHLNSLADAVNRAWDQ